MNFMEKSTLKLHTKDREIEQTPIFGSKAIEILDYIDLGTWPEIRRMILDYENNYN